MKRNYIFDKLDGATIAKRAFVLALKISRGLKENIYLLLVGTWHKPGTIVPYYHCQRADTTTKKVKRLIYGLTVIIDNYKAIR